VQVLKRACQVVGEVGEVGKQL